MNLLNSKKVINVLLVVLSAAYPFAIYFSAGQIQTSYIIIGLMVILFLRAVLQRDGMSLIIFVAMLSLYLLNAELATIMYPVIVSSTFAFLLAWTLIYPPSLIERFARILEPDLNKEGVVYTRKVTIIWLIFSMFNACIALITVLMNDPDIWLLYNGLVSYALIGILMVGEYAFRKFYRAKRRKI